MLVFLQLYLAHLLADFLLQPGWMARKKAELSPLALHAGIHIVCAALFMNIDLNRSAFTAIAAVALVHVLIDYVKAKLSKDGWLAFTIDQSAHLVVVALAAMWLTGSGAEVTAFIRAAAGNPAFYLYACAYVGVVFGGGYLVQKVTQRFLATMKAEIATLKPGLPNAGKYIGWIERILILTFVIAGYEDAVGFLLAAKALVRFPEIKEDTKGHFAEYFLVGTMTSVGLALVGGIVVKKLELFLG